MALWIDLNSAFQKAYEQKPRDDSMIGRIYSYADWCKSAPRGPDAGRDPLTAVTVGFYEDIPAHAAAREDMPRWFRVSEIMQNKRVFMYHIGEQGFDELLVHMMKNRHKFVERDSLLSEPLPASKRRQ